ncbi:MAG: cysteine desulfurase [Alphaproteobacteria bacterium]|nr:cysteine desulfurase [Alphaproteobacteria bacterium]
MIYLDYNASVPIRPCAKEAVVATLDMVGNPSSPHHAGRKLRSLIDHSRQAILEEIGAKRLVFTNGGTEANALALAGRGEGPVLVSSIEHDSVLKGTPPHPHLIPVTGEGVVDLVKLREMLSFFATPGLLSLMLVNNETGVIQPVQEAAQIAAAKGWKIHTDASQALGQISFSFEGLGVDMMTLSSHKCGGPVGIGALVLKEDTQPHPLIRGGGQEYGMRAGTLAAPLILGFAAAFKEALAEQFQASKRLRGLQQTIEDSLTDAIIYGKNSSRAPNVVCLGMPGVSAELQLMSFDLKGIAVSAGSACSSGKMKTSHVLAAMDISPEQAKCAIRVSMGWKTNENQVDIFIQAWKNIYDTLQSTAEIF